ncbi:MAG: D-2-hydroxyacid dehydrogenase [Woeseiaceae bacterium]
MKAVFLDYATVRSEHLAIGPLEAIVSSLTLHDHTQPDQVTDRIDDADIVIVNKVQMTREIIAACGQLKLIGLIATGVDNVDLAAAKENGVAVCNIRAYCTNSVVEHVFAVLLRMTHSIESYHQGVRAGSWQDSQSFCLLDYPIRELSAMTLGIIGYGELGRAVHRMADAFGMRVRIARRLGTPVVADDGRLDFAELLERCDVITLHCPLTDATRNLIDGDALALMQPDALLINTARGGLVDSKALVDALAARSIGGAAIDVLTREPPVDGDALLDYRGSNLIVTPHVAWATEEARQNAVDEVAANVESFIEGGMRNRVV